MGSAQVDAWKVVEVRRYLEKKFPGARLDDYPRGAVAHLFVVLEPGTDPRRQQRHHLMITRNFFDRFVDPATLKDGLDAAEVGRALIRAGDRSVDLY